MKNDTKSNCIEGLCVKIVLKKNLKNVPEEALSGVMMSILSKQSIQKSFTLLVDNESHSGNQSEAVWVKVDSVVQDVPDIGIAMKICFAGTDVIWNCRLIIPSAYVQKKGRKAFFKSIKWIAHGLYGKMKSEQTAPSPAGHEKVLGGAPVVRSVQVDDVIGQSDISSEDVKGDQDVADVSSSTDISDGSVKNDPDIADVPQKDVSGEGERKVEPKRKRAEMFKNIFYQTRVNNFIASFIEKAGGENRTLLLGEVFLIFEKMQLECNFKDAIHHLVIQRIIERKRRVDGEFIWLTTASKQSHALQLLNEREGDSLALIAELQKEKEMLQSKLDAQHEENRATDELLSLVRENIERRNETLDALKKEKSSKKRSVLMNILAECMECEEDIVEQIAKREEARQSA